MHNLLRPALLIPRKHISTLLARSYSETSISAAQVPWFVDDELPRRHSPPHLAQSPLERTNAMPVPSDLPNYLSKLHTELCKSPHLEPGYIEIRPPPPTQPGPTLPSSQPKGRRKRGRTDFGLGVPEPEGSGLWRWIVLAQVKEGTERRGALQSVMRIVRKTLLTVDPKLPLPPNRKRQFEDGWIMLDAGEFAVHIVSRSAREKYFPSSGEARTWHW